MKTVVSELHHGPANDLVHVHKVVFVLIAGELGVFGHAVLAAVRVDNQLCGLMATVDAGNRGIPYESPSNKNLKMDACVLADGTPVNLTWNQVDLIAGSWGVVTAVNFLDSGWVAKGNYTACYPGNTDVKDQFIPVSRMFDFIGNTLIRTFWSKLDKPMTPALRDSILQTCNIWLGGLTGGGYLYGARAEMLAEENPHNTRCSCPWRPTRNPGS